MLRFPAAPVIHKQDHLGKSDRDLKVQKGQRYQFLNMLSVEQGKEEAELNGNDVKSVHKPGQCHHHTELGGCGRVKGT